VHLIGSTGVMMYYRMAVTDFVCICLVAAWLSGNAFVLIMVVAINVVALRRARLVDR